MDTSRAVIAVAMAIVVIGAFVGAVVLFGGGHESVSPEPEPAPEDPPTRTLKRPRSSTEILPPGKPSLRKLLMRLVGGTDIQRAEVLHELTDRYKGEVEEKLIDVVLHDSDVDLRLHTFIIFCGVGTQKTSPQVLQVAEQETDSRIRRLAIARLGQLKYQGAAPWLMTFARESDSGEPLLEEALVSLAAISEEHAYALFEELLRDESRDPDFAPVSAALRRLETARSAEMMLSHWKRLSLAAGFEDMGKYSCFIRDLARFPLSILEPLANTFVLKERDKSLFTAFSFAMSGAEKEFAIRFLSGIAKGPHFWGIRVQAWLALGHMNLPEVSVIMCDAIINAKNRWDAFTVFEGLMKIEPKNLNYAKMVEAYRRQNDLEFREMLSFRILAMEALKKDRETIDLLRTRALGTLDTHRFKHGAVDVLLGISPLHGRGLQDVAMLYERLRDDRVFAPKVAAAAARLEGGSDWVAAYEQHAYDVSVETETRRLLVTLLLRIGTAETFKKTLMVMKTSRDFAQALELAAIIRKAGSPDQLEMARKTAAEMKDEVRRRELTKALK